MEVIILRKQSSVTKLVTHQNTCSPFVRLSWCKFCSWDTSQVNKRSEEYNEWRRYSTHSLPFLHLFFKILELLVWSTGFIFYLMILGFSSYIYDNFLNHNDSKMSKRDDRSRKCTYHSHVFVVIVWLCGLKEDREQGTLEHLNLELGTLVPASASLDKNTSSDQRLCETSPGWVDCKPQ